MAVHMVGMPHLWGATFTPDTFCCAVDIVGPCNLISNIQSMPPYWARAPWEKRIGSLTDIEFLKSRSPLFKIDNIKIPILIAHGAHDVRVPQSESEQIVAAMQKKGIPYEYLLFKDEGHGFARPENRMIFYAAAEKFLADNMKK
jgi:dipeptidyl aminopeptidase/acylaminoacyl peptidase